MISKQLKELLQNYLSVNTSINNWKDNGELIPSGVGFINIYKAERSLESQKVFNPKSLKNTEYSIELSIVFSGLEKDLLDKLVLGKIDEVLNVIYILSRNGIDLTTIPISPDYISPTIFKGICFEQWIKEIEEVTTGNQIEVQDQLWKVIGKIYLKLIV